MFYSLQKTFLAHQASLRTELTGLIVAKSTSPGLLDKTFFGVIKKLILWSLHHNLEKSYADWFFGKLVKTFYTGTYSHRFNSFDEFLAF